MIIKLTQENKSSIITGYAKSLAQDNINKDNAIIILIIIITASVQHTSSG